MHIVTSDNHATLIMNTDDSTSNRGFYLKYKTFCNRTIEMNSGVLESPNFPGQYPPDMDCSWKIVVPKGNRITLQFSHFNLENEGKLSNETNVSDQN
jgi:cubilin